MYLSEELGQYPTDDKGFPLDPREVDPRFDDHTDDYCVLPNNHHLNFYRRHFGETAIAQTFRDLESFQLVMPRWKHSLLHDNYTGIDVPLYPNMMERIEEEKEKHGRLKIYNEVTKEYEYFDIDNTRMQELKAEYNTLAASRFVVARLVYKKA